MTSDLVSGLPAAVRLSSSRVNSGVSAINLAGQCPGGVVVVGSRTDQGGADRGGWGLGSAQTVGPARGPAATEQGAVRRGSKTESQIQDQGGQGFYYGSVVLSGVVGDGQPNRSGWS